MPHRSYYDDEWYYQPSRPLPAKDGIKARNARGAFGASWWAQRWIKVLESFGWGSRLQRGRSYARSGQVLSIDLEAGRVRARVQGSRPAPYKVTIEVRPLTDEQWERASNAMAEQAIFAAKLLSGEMPQNIEEAFTAADVSLFPQSARDIDTQCSCPDYANPCKHIAAVYYLLGERFDEDPFLIFHLRGRTREQIVEALRSRRAATSTDAASEVAPPTEPVPALTDQLGTYYQAGPELQSISVQIAAPDVEAGILRRLGAAPADIDPDLHAVYHTMTVYVLNRVFGGE
ncbi:MAG: SWIM zinc finger family protein [Chloroflexota bacterium]|nr:SWIM zinc finger family protein [Chloroflexota bacterium]